ncbi:KduI/IolB family isomerase domain-containing protein (plasmid) [Rhizobium gallicum]|uniref:KduI/IolB family isomerase domain-containing protein n=1 Tax=Rhizobium gallicum TaxID=56730 RepID=A0A1L5NS29_9HYPH|nr:KduI/IolB family isomerase domain-containing protein [Rhizobium gallicum]
MEKPMTTLLRKPFGRHGKVHAITPQSAGWRYVGFSLYRLRKGERIAETTDDREVILVMVEGKAAFTAAGQNWGVLGERMNVFEKTPPRRLSSIPRTGAIDAASWLSRNEYIESIGRR